jgi:3'-phosphoadenosine 5'-phosphosulfate (PAPS) 3'-phosphatase
VKPWKLEQVAGAGNKFIHMADNKSDFYINLVPGIKHWDMCGSEALYLSRFGILCDATRCPLYYDDNAIDHTLPHGIIAAKNSNIFSEC